MFSNKSRHQSLYGEVDLGYTNLASFSKKFKKQYGVSPSQYKVTKIYPL